MFNSDNVPDINQSKFL